MLLDQVTDAQMQAASVLGGAAMAAFLGARFFPQRAQLVRIVVVCVYVAGVAGFVAYVLLT
jgi:hypothetical protein